jgi:hypothetical protein
MKFISYRISTVLFVVALTFLTVPVPAFAGSATWDLNPGSNDWNASNWTPQTVPNGAFDTATFDLSNTTVVSVTANTEVNGIVFNPNAAFNPFIITRTPGATLFISGVGITNNSGADQLFVVATNGSGSFEEIGFLNSATSGRDSVFTNNGASVSHALGASAAEIFFNDISNAGSATINNNGGTTMFASGGETIFSAFSNANNSMLIANAGSGGQLGRPGGFGGAIFFNETSTGGTARVELFGNGSIDISGHSAPGVGFAFEFNQAGSPTYSNAAASGNALLHLTDPTPFTAPLTSANRITIDFAGASLAAGELFRGGFFTDTPMATSILSSANFLYTGTDGFTVNFDGVVTEPMAAFASGTVLNGTVLQFDISRTGTSVPDPGSSVLLFGLALAGLALFQCALGLQKARAGAA